MFCGCYCCWCYSCTLAKWQSSDIAGKNASCRLDQAKCWLACVGLQVWS